MTKNHAAYSKMESLLKIDFKADWTHESIPTAWELKNINLTFILSWIYSQRDVFPIMLFCQVESKLLHCRITVWTLKKFIQKIFYSEDEISYLIFGVFGRKLFFLKWLTAIGRAKREFPVPLIPAISAESTVSVCCTYDIWIDSQYSSEILPEFWVKKSQQASEQSDSAAQKSAEPKTSKNLSDSLRQTQILVNSDEKFSVYRYQILKFSPSN